MFIEDGSYFIKNGCCTIQDGSGSLLVMLKTVVVS